MDYFLGKITEMLVTGNLRVSLVPINYACILFCSTGNKLFVRSHKRILRAKYIPIVLGNFVYTIHHKAVYKLILVN
jgi:hypothetical protein